jgi:trk system potassium uptake protein TrkA
MKNSENILILGLGGVGFYLAKRLSHEGHAITAIEQSPDLIRRADGEIDARLIRGDAMSFLTWAEAGANEMDYLIAVTDNDAVNIMGALIAERCGIRRKIARVRSLEVWQDNALLTASDLKIDLVIRPEELAAQEIARLLKIRAGNVVIDIAERQMQVIGMRIDEDSPFAGANLKELSKKYDHSYFRVVSIARGINTIIPSGDEELLPHDNAFILARSEHVPRLMQMAGVPQESRHRVLIIGGGLVGSRVAQLLENTFPVRLIERDERRAEELSHSLENTELLHGDGSKRDVLLQAGLLDMDTIIAATSDNETNIMSCVLAKSVIEHHNGGKKGKTIALVGREEYLVLASTMGSDIVLSKKVLAANEILKYIRRGQLLSVAHLHGLEAEVVELVVGEGAAITRKPLYQIEGLKGRIIIGGYSRGESWQTAVGSTHLEPGDKVIAVCTSERLKDLQELILG